MRRIVFGLALSAMVAGLPGIAGARGQAGQQASQLALQEKLTAAKGLKCVFQLEATATWTKGGAPQGEVKPVTLNITFVGINTDESTARMLSSFGTYDMVVREMAGNLHFIQPLRSGALYATTVFAKESQPGKFKAVHSRHEFVEIQLPGFTSRPEQYYGECEVVP